MHAAAAKAGVALQIISATRNFEYQKGIWEKKWLREKYKGMTDLEKVADIMKYSSMPGTSRHHWGTDVDFNSVELSFWQSGPGQKMYNWLVANASTFGFYQTYTNKSSGRSGYEEEKWHWSYLPLAKEMHRQYLSHITYTDLKGFNGCAAAEELRVFDKYVNGIDSICKP
jgi:LAS superfamily LD-carboxypeptidase LdcB